MQKSGPVDGPQGLLKKAWNYPEVCVHICARVF